MSSTNMVGLCSNDLGGGERETVKLEPKLVENSIPQMQYCELTPCHIKNPQAAAGGKILHHKCSAPLSRQFWKAGNYDEGRATKSTLKYYALKRLKFPAHLPKVPSLKRFP